MVYIELLFISSGRVNYVFCVFSSLTVALRLLFFHVILLLTYSPALYLFHSNCSFLLLSLCVFFLILSFFWITHCRPFSMFLPALILDCHSILDYLCVIPFWTLFSSFPGITLNYPFSPTLWSSLGYFPSLHPHTCLSVLSLWQWTMETSLMSTFQSWTSPSLTLEWFLYEMFFVKLKKL